MLAYKSDTIWEKPTHETEEHMCKEPEEDPDMRNTTVRDQQENSDQEDVNSPQTDHIHNSNEKTQLPFFSFFFY